jgi:CTP synthase (UTP-ammonia lyase)
MLRSMARVLHLGAIGDFDATNATHRATNEAPRHAGSAMGVDVDVQWFATDELEGDVRGLETADGLWCAPGSPYRSLVGAVAALRFGREQRIPTLGTCGGCQHMIIEYARNVLGVEEAGHGEYDPYQSNLFVTPLSCSHVGLSMPVLLTPASTVAATYGVERTVEQYYCNFGLDPSYRQVLDDGGFRVVGVDDDGEARVFEFPQHPFYIATLFCPQTRSTPDDHIPWSLAGSAVCSNGRGGTGCPRGRSQDARTRLRGVVFIRARPSTPLKARTIATAATQWKPATQG